MRNSSVPAYFRACILEARSTRNGYAAAGWHLAIHLEEHAEFEELGGLDDALASESPEVELWGWLRRSLPNWVALVPARRRPNFMKGVMTAVEQGRVL